MLHVQRLLPSEAFWELPAVGLRECTFFVLAFCGLFGPRHLDTSELMSLKQPDPNLEGSSIRCAKPHQNTKPSSKTLSKASSNTLSKNKSKTSSYPLPRLPPRFLPSPEQAGRRGRRLGQEAGRVRRLPAEVRQGDASSPWVKRPILTLGPNWCRRVFLLK